jgi:hypothetical protein
VHVAAPCAGLGLASRETEPVRASAVPTASAHVDIRITKQDDHFISRLYPKWCVTPSVVLQ